MATLAEIRSQYPQYQDMPDAALADALHKKFYSDMPVEDFNKRLGIQSAQPSTALERVGSGFMDPFYSQAQLGAKLNPEEELGSTLAGSLSQDNFADMPLTPSSRGAQFESEKKQRAQGIDEMSAKRAADYQASRAAAGSTGIDWAKGIGHAANALIDPLNYIGPGGLAAKAGMGALSSIGGDIGGEIGGTPGAIAGGLLGGIAGAKGGDIPNPIVSNFRAWKNPEGYAQRQVARAVSESGKTPEELSQAITNSAAAGQDQFTLADALGSPGQRMLYSAAGAPGAGRTNATEFLNARQAGQGNRVSQILDEALGANETASQYSKNLTNQAMEQSKPFYEESLGKPVWSERLQQYFDDPVTQAGLKKGIAVQRLESLAENKKFDPKDYGITGFNEAGDPIITGNPNMRTINLIKKGWDTQLESYRSPLTGKLQLDEYGRALDNVRRTFLNEVDSLNPAYAKARSLYAGPAQAREATNVGKQAATRGRPEDNINRFNLLNEPSKQGFRTGYANALNEKIERGRQGVNAGGPLTSQKYQNELGALSLHQGPVAPGQLDTLQQRLAREQTMFETRNKALGGSRTAENIEDQSSLSLDPHVVRHLLTGDLGGAVRSAVAAGGNAVSGNTAAVREQLAKILLTHGANTNETQRNALLAQILAHGQKPGVNPIQAALVGALTGSQNAP